MTTPAVFVAQSVTFGAVTLTGITDVSTPESGNATTLESDANPFIQGVYVDGIGASPTVSTTDILQATNSAFDIGTKATLTITYQKRALGKGAAGTNRTVTYPNAVVVSRDPKANTTGKGDASITFQAFVNDTGTAICTWG
jgi:hypothetical protein